jgi:hypothetical protein
MQCRKVSRDKYNKREREKRDKLCPQSLTHIGTEQGSSRVRRRILVV